MRAVDEVVDAVGAYPGTSHSFLVGTPPFPHPAVLGTALAAAADGDFDYAPAAGLPELRRLLAGMSSSADARLGVDHVVVTHGGKGGLLVALAALIEPGDAVIHPEPCYPAYPTMVRRFGGEAVGLPESGAGFSSWVARVAARIGPRTRAVVVASPSNPSGTTLTAVSAAALIELCRQHGIALLIDEAYVHFGPPGPAVDLARLDPDLTTVIRFRSAAKSWAIPGWRAGWIVASGERCRRFTAIQASLLNPPNTPVQRALLSLPEVGSSYLIDARREVRQRLDTMARALSEAGLEVDSPAGGFYLWIDLRAHLGVRAPTSLDWCRTAAADHGVALWPGEDFSAPGFARLAARADDDWERTCAVVAARVTSLL